MQHFLVHTAKAAYDFNSQGSIRPSLEWNPQG